MTRTQERAFKSWKKKGFIVSFTDRKGNLIIKREVKNDRGKLTGRFDYKVIAQNGHTENFYK